MPLIFRLATVLLLCLSAPAAEAEPADAIDAKVTAALAELYADEPDAKLLADNSVAVLVFPDIVKAGALVGGQYGEGALRAGGRTLGYFSIASASFGLQFGAQRYGYVMFLLTESALDYLRDTRGFELGVGPTLVGGDKGWSSSLGTNNLQGDIAPVFFNQEGFMAGGGIQGSKISRIER